MSRRRASEWFKFYHGDFWGPGPVHGLSDSAIAGYVFLLGVQAEHGYIPGTDDGVVAILPRRWSGRAARAVWSELEPHFPPGADGRRRNERQASVLQASDDRRESERLRKQAQRDAKRALRGQKPNVSHGRPVGTSAPVLLSSSLLNSDSGSVSSSLSETSSAREGAVACECEADAPRPKLLPALNATIAKLEAERAASPRRGRVPS